MFVVWPVALAPADVTLGTTPVLGDYPLWDPAVTYSVGDRVSTPDGKVWEAPFTSCVLAGVTEVNLNRDPATSQEGFLAPYATVFTPRAYLRPNVTYLHFWWTLIPIEGAEALNEYFMLTPPLYRKTSQASPFTFTVSPRYQADAIALFALSATSVTVNGETKAKPAHLRHLLFTEVEFPAEVTVTAPSMAEVGYLCVGHFSRVARSDYGTELGFKDYSHKPRQFDGDGSIDIIERDYSDTVTFRSQTATRHLRQTTRFLAQLRATPAAYIAHLNLPETLTFGYYQDFAIPISDYPDSELSLSVEGLV